jgi:uncharacterized protein (DUF2249 family)
MNDVIIATTQGDAEARDAVEEHHAQMSGALHQLVGELAASGGDHAVRDRLVSWCDRELVPHAQAEEKALYPAGLASTGGRLLVEAMLAEHGVIVGLVDQLRTAEGARTLTAAGGLLAVFDSHLTKENEQLLPLLVADPSVSLHDLLGGMHELLGESDAADAAEAPAGGGHGCACGGHDEPGYPELDARVVPHAIRHATIFGALGSVQPGQGMVLVADHEPLPLLAQLEQRQPGAFEVSYLEQGPADWRLLFRRR